MSRSYLERELVLKAQQELERRLNEKAKAENRLRDFVRAGWHVVEPGRKFVPNWHLDAICDHLEAVTLGQIRFLVINIPPRCMKSLAVSVFWPCWEWTKFPSNRFLCSSYAQRLSIRDSVKCRRLITSPWYQSFWGENFVLTGDQNEKGRFENNKTGYRISTSVGGTGTGEGGDRIVVDDPISADDANSDIKRENTNDWWDDTMSTRGNDPMKAAFVIVMQRLHEDDLSGHVLKTGLYTHLNLPMEFEPKNRCVVFLKGHKFFEDPRTRNGELLWPERIDDSTLDRYKKTMTSYAIAGQFQQRPAPEEGGIFKKAWFRRFGPKSDLDLPTSGLHVIQSWDMSFKDTDGSDFVCGLVLGRHGPNFYVMDRDKRRLDFPKTCQAVLTMTAKWPSAHAKCVEDKANGSAVISLLRQKIPGMIEIQPEGGKKARAHAIAPVCESGNVYLPEDAPWVDDFIYELCSFPNATHDDQVDAFTQGILRLLKVGGGIMAWYDDLLGEQALNSPATDENSSLQTTVPNGTIASSVKISTVRQQKMFPDKPSAEQWTVN